MPDPPIALVHGLGSSFAHGWQATGWTDLLADTGRTVIPVDILGHGTADAPHDPAAYAHLEDSVARALPDEPVDAIGFSLGAQLLLRLAAERPERFAHLVCIGAGENVFRTDDATTLADAFTSEVDPADLHARLFVQLARSAGNDPSRSRRASAVRTSRSHRPTRLGSRCPTLVIIGDRDFAGPPEPLVDALPDARLVVLRGIDHFRTPSEFACIDAALEFVGAAL